MKKDKNIYIIVALVLIIIGISGYTYFQYKKSTGLEFDLRSKITNFEAEIQNYIKTISSLEEEVALLSENLKLKEEELQENEEKTEKLNKEVKTALEIITIDEELLQKYSKVYFLNEHYIPKTLTYISDKYLSNTKKPLEIQTGVQDNLEEMLEDALDDGVTIKVLSAYRSFDEQEVLKYNYKIQYGYGSNAFSADQGYSEHQLGTTVDLTTDTIGSSLSTTFDQTEAYKWLEKNAYKYGFILSYPKSNTYYQYEPWHWRFVSKNLAEKLHDEEKNFYDLDQREIFQYKLDFFD